jgi:integrase
MPATTRHTPKYRHFKPKNLAVVRIDGHDHYLGRYDSPESHEKYHRLLAEHAVKGGVTLNAENEPETGSDTLSVNELILAYFRHAEGYYVKNGEPTTEIGVIRQALKPIRKLYGLSLAKDFGPLALKACREAMVAKGWSRKSINRQVGRLRKMFAWGVANELIPATVFEALKTVEGLRKGRSAARERPPISPVLDEVVEKTLTHLLPTVAAMVRLQRLTGMRPQEVVGLRRVDLEMGDATCWVYRPDRHKGEHHERDRVIYIGPRAIDVLKPFLSLDSSKCIFSPQRSEAERNARRRAERKTPLYDSHVSHQARKWKRRSRRPLGDHYTVGTYRQAIHRACDAAFPHATLSPLTLEDLSSSQREQFRHLRKVLRCKDLPEDRRNEITTAISALFRRDLPPDQRTELEAWRKANRWHPHALRHSAATQIWGQYGLEGAQAVLGHNELRTTQVYSEKNMDAARKIMREIG